MIDLTDCEELGNQYGGSESKRTLLYNGKIYMVKFPDPLREQNNDLSYMNNQFSEDIGCRIFKSLGINTQNTFLAKFSDETGKSKIVVACEDFCKEGQRLLEFSKLMLADTKSKRKYKTSVESVMEAIDRISVPVKKDDLKDNFWDMMVGDSLINNGDRHLDNWGVLRTGKKLEFAPVYDCGSSLAALVSDESMKKTILNMAEFKNDEFNVSSAYTHNGKKIFYHEIFENPPEGLQKAILRIVPKINMKKIYNIVNNTEEMTDIRKEYLNKSLNLRYEKILKPALEKEFKKQREFSR